MIQRNKFSVLFYLRDDRAKEGKAPNYCLIFYYQPSRRTNDAFLIQ